jgi:uncharacterized membrane protein YdfJ with MMPL/SSD domain
MNTLINMLIVKTPGIDTAWGIIGTDQIFNPLYFGSLKKFTNFVLL